MTILTLFDASDRIQSALWEGLDPLNKDDVKAVETALAAIEKQIPKPPVPDENATDRFGRPVPRCQVCGYALDLQIEQYCPCCGQRLTEYPENEVKG